MRWCISTARYAPSTGGVERFCEGLARQLVSEGDEVLVLAGDSDGRMDDDDSNGHSRVLRIHSLGLANGRMPVPVPGRSLARTLREAVAWNCDAMLVNTNLYPQSLLALEVAKRSNAPAVMLEHGSAHVGTGSFLVDAAENAWEHLITTAARAYSPVFCGVSERSASWLGHFSVIPSGVIHNAVDADAFALSASARDFRSELGMREKELLVTFSGRLVSGKGADLVVEAARICDARGIPARFAVAGDGPLFGELCGRSNGGLTMLGALGRSDMAALLRQTDVFLFPSSYPEGMPTTLLEAAVSGAAIVTTDVGGAREIIPDDRHGIILEGTEPEVMAEIVSWYAENPTVMRAQARLCGERVSRLFTWERTARELRATVGVEQPF